MYLKFPASHAIYVNRDARTFPVTPLLYFMTVTRGTDGDRLRHLLCQWPTASIHLVASDLISAAGEEEDLECN